MKKILIIITILMMIISTTIIIRADTTTPESTLIALGTGWEKLYEEELPADIRPYMNGEYFYYMRYSTTNNSHFIVFSKNKNIKVETVEPPSESSSLIAVRWYDGTSYVNSTVAQLCRIELKKQGGIVTELSRTDPLYTTTYTQANWTMSNIEYISGIYGNDHTTIYQSQFGLHYSPNLIEYKPIETTQPPVVTTAPPEITTAPPEVTTAPPEVTTAPPEVTTAAPVITTPSGSEPPTTEQLIFVYVKGITVVLIMTLGILIIKIGVINKWRS